MSARPRHTAGDMASLRLVPRLNRIAIAAVSVVCAGGTASSGVAATHLDAATSSCASSAVQYQADPTAGAGVESLPWIQATPASEGLVGHLFYYPGTPWEMASLPRARIYTGGSTPTGGATKILWTAHGTGTGLELVVRGKRLDARGSFTQRFPVAGGNGFPSILKVPTAGCWQLHLASGSRSARVTLFAVKSS